MAQSAVGEAGSCYQALWGRNMSVPPSSRKFGLHFRKMATMSCQSGTVIAPLRSCGHRLYDQKIGEIHSTDGKDISMLQVTLGFFQFERRYVGFTPAFARR